MTLPKGNPRIPEGINASEENPLKEFAMLAIGVSAGLAIMVVAISFIASILTPYIPFEWERAFNPAMVASLYEDEKEEGEEGEPSGATAQAALDDLSQALLQSSLQVPIGNKAPQDVVPIDAFVFHFMSEEMPNAFATFGANVMVTSGLLKEVSSENGLAMVIAHEIAHVQLRHPIEAAGRGIVIQIALTAILGSTGSGLFGGAVSSGGNLALLSYNREMELAADTRALRILRQHYGHVGGADEFFLAIDEAQGSARWLEFVQTHPSTQRRLAIIGAAVAADVQTSNLKEMPGALQNAQ